MGSMCNVDGWVFSKSAGIAYFVPLYEGKSILMALWVGFKNRKEYGCVRIELRK